MSAAEFTPREARARSRRLRSSNPVVRLVTVRLLFGVITLLLVSLVIFAATQALPGNAAYSVLGRSATPARLHAVEDQLKLNRPLTAQYTSWIGGVLHGNFGKSLANGESVSSLIGSRVANSATLVIFAGLIGTLVAGGLGILAAARRDTWLDHTLSTIALALAALPEFVVGLLLVVIFSVTVSHLLPAVSAIPPGTEPWSVPKELILPVATLALVVAPYIFRIARGAMVEALESDYLEMARLKGVAPARALLLHALPNAIPPIVQVVGLNLLYLAGGIVVVEYVFNYPGIGAALVDAVSNRDIPTIQFIVLLLTTFYVFVNITTDVIALLASPRRRTSR